MTKSLQNEIHSKISMSLLEPNFLKKISISEMTLQGYIYRETFSNKLKEIVENNDYTCTEVFELCKDIINEQAEGIEVENWLYYIYQYTLNKSFPEAVVIELNERLDDICLIYLEILRVILYFEQRYGNGWAAKYPLELLTENELDDLENPEEYLKFKEAYYEEYIYEMMKLNQEVLGYNSLEHISAVHFLALHVGRQLKEIGIPIDLGRVSGSAAGHDIGKFGCKKEESSKVAYLHYYYTEQWFKKHDIVYIRNIAINHSTWDLELENLPIESLILIYSDFRVKNKTMDDGSFKMHIFTLEEVFDVILGKLDNLDKAKEMRYTRVYNKLKDFEDYMVDLGVNADLERSYEGDYSRKKYYSLLQGDSIIENLKYLSINHNINLMYKLRNEASLGSLIEKARSETNPHNLREYLYIFEEYSTYLTPKQKLITIRFLFERLTHSDEDIRKQCASMIGLLIAYFDEAYRKTVPDDVKLEAPELTSHELLNTYIELLVYPKQNLISIHRNWLANSITHIIRSLFEHSKDYQNEGFARELTKYYEADIKENKIKLYLLISLKYMPMTKCPLEFQNATLDFISRNLEDEDDILRIATLETIYYLIPKFAEGSMIENLAKERIVTLQDYSSIPVENYIKLKILNYLDVDNSIVELFKEYHIRDYDKIPSMFLSNLKTATNWIIKRIQVDLLMEYTIANYEARGFHTAMHLCNLLKVSERETVRNRGGEALIKIMPYLSPEQRNDIAVELIRALEIEGFQFTEYIPTYLGELILYLQPIELDETIDDLLTKVKLSSVQIVSLLIKTVGISIENYYKYNELFHEEGNINKSRLKRMLSILLSGLVHYNIEIKQVAFSVIGKTIFGSTKLTLEHKHEIFKLIGKKILTLLDENKDDMELLFLTNAAALNNIYRFIADYKFYKADVAITTNNRVAFFPGTFDPFSLSHKEIVKNIRDLGFEVYLGIDEFSWSKRTQPNLIRRNIVKMSIADELGVYLFPEDIPVNIANINDLVRLRNVFHDLDIHIVVGSDVVFNASAYLGKATENSIHTFSHIIFERANNDEEDNADKLLKNILGNVIRLSLPEQYEDISSTQIRNYIDENRDITKLVDPLVKRFIYEKGLYKREPQYKTILQTKSISIEVKNKFSKEFINELTEIIPLDNEECYEKLVKFTKKLTPRVLVVRDIKNNGRMIGFSAFHWIRSSMMYQEFQDSNITEFVRSNYIGRTIVIDGIFVNKETTLDNPENIEQMILNETLTFCLAKDYTYGVFHSMIDGYNPGKLYEALELQGFQRIMGSNGENPAYVVDMTAPCTLNLDIETIMKAPFVHNNNVKIAIKNTRKRLQKAISSLYPGKLLISFDMHMVYENMIKKICDENGVSSEPDPLKRRGEAMCVPFGEILNGAIVPNTVTKSLHTEKFFSPNIKTYRIGPYPNYLSLENQVKMLRSFNRPVILVDDLLHKGYRIKGIDPLLKKEKINVKKIIVGILSGRGKELMDLQEREVDSAYFIPKLNVWFEESFLYPFVEGHSLWRGYNSKGKGKLLPAVNLILPYTSPTFIKGTTNKNIFELSKTCIENSIEIFTVLESEYQKMNERKLTLSNLGEVFASSKYPDHGEDVNYDLNLNPSHYLKNDLNHLKRLEYMLTGE